MGYKSLLGCSEHIMVSLRTEYILLCSQADHQYEHFIHRECHL